MIEMFQYSSIDDTKYIITVRENVYFYVDFIEYSQWPNFYGVYIGAKKKDDGTVDWTARLDIDSTGKKILLNTFKDLSKNFWNIKKPKGTVNIYNRLTLLPYIGAIEEDAGVNNSITCQGNDHKWVRLTFDNSADREEMETIFNEILHTIDFT